MESVSLEQRIRALELRCRRLTLGLVVLGSTLGGACLTAALGPTAAVLRAERFELVNAKGEVRGRLEMEGATPRLVLESPEIGSLASLSAGPSARRPYEGDPLFKKLGSQSMEIGWVGSERTPSRRGLATLCLSGSERNSPWTELQVSPDGNTLFMSSAGPTLLMASGVPEGPDAGAFLTICAENSSSEGTFGHASFGATQDGAYAALGADDVDLVQLEGAKGQPLIELHDGSDATLFHAP